ncbi:MAG: hypothetical protein F4210_17525 [Holophagales bacterium]|nr:hypothetical protein [Holophagales bacterium]MYF97260.1 hypothetical protein [Holophagales bacterium]
MPGSRLARSGDSPGLAVLRQWRFLPLWLFLVFPGGSIQAQRLLDIGPLVVDPVVVDEGVVPYAARLDIDLIRSAPRRLEVDVPDGRLVVAELSVFEDRGGGDAMWAGKVAGSDYESVVFTIVDDHLAGHFGVPGGAKYRISARPDGRGRIEDPTTMLRRPKEEYCPGGVPLDRPLPVAALEVQRGGVAEGVTSASNHNVIDIMILYSEAAGERYILRDGAIEPTINNSIDYLNTVFRNGQLDVVARLAHLQQAPASLSVEGGGSAVLNRLRLNQEIRDLRIEHNADLVHLFTTAEVRNVCGIAYLLQKGQTWRSFWPLGYGLTVMQGCGDETFAHEIGHNLGANHDPPNAGSNWEDADRRNNVSVQPYAFGHTWFTGQHPNIPDRDTIMSYGSGRPEPWFSTVRVQPRIEGRSAVFGIANERENERALRGTVGTVARLSDGLPRGTGPEPEPPPPPGAGPTAPGSLTGMSTGPTSVRLSWADRSDDETGFEVQLRRRGSGWRTDSTMPANTTTADVTGLTPGGRYDFRVRSFNSGGRSASDLVTIVLPSTDFSDCVPSAPLITFDHGFTVSMCVEYLEGGVGPIVKEDAKDYGLDSDESGILYFFDRDNAEVLVKVLNTCAISDYIWVYVAPVTTLAFNLRIDEVGTDRFWEHRNPRGGGDAPAASALKQFPCDPASAGFAGDAGAPTGFAGNADGVELVDAGIRPTSVRQALAAGERSDCEPQPVATMKGGYEVAMCVEFLKDGEPSSTPVKDYGLDSRQSAVLYFFQKSNAEVLIKVLEPPPGQCGRWVFVAPVTDLAFNIEVRPPDGGAPWTHGNPFGQTAAAVSDLEAFCSP